MVKPRQDIDFETLASPSTQDLAPSQPAIARGTPYEF
jgi:hypothetical protein